MRGTPGRRHGEWGEGPEGRRTCTVGRDTFGVHGEAVHVAAVALQHPDGGGAFPDPLPDGVVRGAWEGGDGTGTVTNTQGRHCSDATDLFASVVAFLRFGSTA